MQTESDLPGVLLISFVFNFRRCFLRSFVPAPICPVTFPVCVCLSCVLFAGHWPSRGNNFYAVALVKLAWQSPQGGGRMGMGDEKDVDAKGCCGCGCSSGPWTEQSKVHLKADLIT